MRTLASLPRTVRRLPPPPPQKKGAVGWGEIASPNSTFATLACVSPLRGQHCNICGLVGGQHDTRDASRCGAAGQSEASDHHLDSCRDNFLQNINNAALWNQLANQLVLQRVGNHKMTNFWIEAETNPGLFKPRTCENCAASFCASKVQPEYTCTRHRPRRAPLLLEGMCRCRRSMQAILGAPPTQGARVEQATGFIPFSSASAPLHDRHVQPPPPGPAAAGQHTAAS